MIAKETITFRVSGTPRPKGSWKSFNSRTTGRVVTLPDNKHLVAWVHSVRLVAKQHRPKGGLWAGAVGLYLTAHLPRPNSVSVRQRPLPTTKPDLDKLVRALGDALSGIIWVDDAQVVQLSADKKYALGPDLVSMEIIVSRFEEEAGRL